MLRFVLLLNKMVFLLLLLVRAIGLRVRIPFRLAVAVCFVQFVALIDQAIFQCFVNAREDLVFDIGIDRSLVMEWEKSGAIYGWLYRDANGFLKWAPGFSRANEDDLKMAADLTPAFKFGEVSSKILDALPLPSVRFGLDLSNASIGDDDLRHISRFKMVSILNLEKNNVSDAGVDVLSKMVALESLSLSSNRISGKGLKSLLEISSLKNLYLSRTLLTDSSLASFAGKGTLNFLDISWTPITGDGLAGFPELKNIVGLSICGVNQMTARGLRQIMKCRNLKSLFLCESTFDTSALNALSDFDSIIALDLSHSQLPESELSGFRVAKSIRTINISNNNVISIDGKCFGFSGVEHLNLSFNPLVDSGLKIDGLENTLVSLDLRATKISDEVFSVINKMKKLEDISFQGTAVSGIGLSKIVDGGAIRFLNFANTNIRAEGISLLKKLKNIESLNLNENSLDNVAFVNLASITGLKKLSISKTGLLDSYCGFLKKLPNLEYLNVQGNAVEGGGLEALKKQGCLKCLNLGQTNVSDSGLQYISECKNLEFINLSETKVTNAGIKYLGDLEKICYLNLNSTKIDNYGIAGLEGLKSLRFIDLQSTMVDSKGVESLRRKLPNCFILSE